jgi:membrane protein
VKLTQRAWVRHLIDAWERLRVTNGNQYAAAITYFSFLAIFPLILLAVSIAGFVLNANQNALHTLFANVGQNVPGELGDTLKSAIRTAVDKRASVGAIGLAGVLLTGLGWIGNLRASLDAVWKRVQPKGNFIKHRIANLGILAGLGAGVLTSLALTTAWAAFSHRVLSTVGLADIPGMGTLLGAIGIAVTVLGGAVIFYWVLVRVPRAPVPRHIGVRGALIAAVGFEVLKIAGTYTIAASAHSPTAGPFAGIIAVLVWIQLVTRWMLFCAAWMAELSDAEAAPVAAAEPGTQEQDADTETAPSPVAVGAGLFGAGAIAGALTAHALHRRAEAIQRPTA